MNQDILLIETYSPVESNILLEETSSGVMKFRGKVQEANIVNKNKRMYPLSVLESNLHRLQEDIVNRRFLSALDHPESTIVSLERASHLITKLWFEGNIMMAEGEILPTPLGMVLRKLSESGVQWGLSSRGVGNGQVNNEGVLVIGESYRLIAFDAVASPSTPEAYPKVIASPTKKHENYIPQKNSFNTSLKNESRSIDIDCRALSAFTEQYIKKQIKEIKNERFK